MLIGFLDHVGAKMQDLKAIESCDQIIDNGSAGHRALRWPPDASIATCGA
jgi:hypothetical protein